MESWEGNCSVCGKVKSRFAMGKLKSVYQVFPDMFNVCSDCGQQINSHLNYYGEKKQEDKDAVRSILLNGFAVNQRYSALMNAGYMACQHNRG